MTPVAADIPYHRLRAPADHGSTYIDPPLSIAREMIDRNRTHIAGTELDLLGMPWADVAFAARRELVRQARNYTAQYRDVAPADSAPASQQTERVLMAGHQPQLFHAGVWFKNFALDSVARAQDAVSVNLIIDNDVPRDCSIRVPTGNLEAPRVEHVDWARPTNLTPYEDQVVHDAEQFNSFGERVATSLSPLIQAPLVERIWPWAADLVRGDANPGRAIAAARHRLEGELGLSTLELPLSRVCATSSFRQFASHLLAHLPRLWDIYNTSLAEYRSAHSIRSQAHPVPDLRRDDEWLEAPLWIWSVADPTRRRLFARGTPDGVELTDRHHISTKLVHTADGDGQRAVEQLSALERSGTRIRPRALITTMYVRMVLCDLFLHGIGGAKYDGLTDLFIRRFWNSEPPGFSTISGTLLLPVRRTPAHPRDLHQVDMRLRQLRYHPEQYIALDGLSSPRERQEVERLAASKRRAVADQPSRGKRRARHLEISEANAALQPYVESQRAKLTDQRVRLAEQVRENAVLSSREYAFCLFPEETLVPLLLEMLPAQP